MDMKKLKQSMWSLLTEIPKQADAEVMGSTHSVGAQHGGGCGLCLSSQISSANVESIHSKIQERHHTSEMNQVYEQAGHTKGDTDGKLGYGTLLSLARNQKNTNDGIFMLL